jgi:hypothetical protein
MAGETGGVTRAELLWAAFAAVAFTASAAVFVVPWLGWPSAANADGPFALASLLAAGSVGAVAWLGIERYAGGHLILGGFAAGALTGVLAHPVAWFLWPIVDVEAQIGASAFLMPLMSVWSLLFVGWITVPLGALAGVVTGVARVAVRRRAGRADADSTSADDRGDPEAEDGQSGHTDLT